MVWGALWAPQWGSWRSPDRSKDFFSLFSAPRMASSDTILLYYCGSHKKNEKFLTHSILSQLMCIWWCCLMFFSIWDWIHSRKVASGGLHCREERRGRRGKFDTLENPASSVGLRPHGPGAPEKLGAPGPTWNLSFVFIYDFWKRKSRKNWKRSIFQIEMTAKEFLVQK